MSAEVSLESPFGGVNAKVADLRNHVAVPAGDGHRDLTEGVWLSSEAGRGSLLAFDPVDRGFKLTLRDAGRSKWVAFGFGIPVDGLRRCRMLGVRVRAWSSDFYSCRPSLRYLLRDGGFVDRFPGDYMLSSGGLHDQMAFIEVDQQTVGESRAAEVNLFFQGNAFEVEFELIEALQIL